MKYGTLYTTFRILREVGACKPRYRYLARKLGGVKKYGEDKPIPILKILEINGFDDALWALCIAMPVDKADKLLRLFNCWCVRNTPLPDGGTVWDLLEDERSRKAVEVAERYAHGKASEEDLAAAGVAAWEASWQSDSCAVGSLAEEAAWTTTWNHPNVAASSFAVIANGDATSWESAAIEAQAKQLRKMLKGS